MLSIKLLLNHVFLKANFSTNWPTWSIQCSSCDVRPYVVCTYVCRILSPSHAIFVSPLICPHITWSVWGLWLVTTKLSTPRPPPHTPPQKNSFGPLKPPKFFILNFFCFGSGATIRIGSEIQFLLYAWFFWKYIFSLHTKLLSFALFDYEIIDSYTTV